MPESRRVAATAVRRRRNRPRAKSPRPPSISGKANGKSNFGTLPAPYPSPSPHCPHDLGGLTLLGKPDKDEAGTIIGVLSVSVTCPRCTRKSSGKVIKGRTISINAMLADARKLFVDYGWPTDSPPLGRCCACDGEDDLRPQSELGECIGPHDEGSHNDGFEFCLDCLTSRADLGLVCRSCTTTYPCRCNEAGDEGECNGTCSGYNGLKRAIESSGTAE